MPHGDDAFARFVEQERPSLLRTGLLLTGDAADAETLVATALTRARRRWRRPVRTEDAVVDVRAALASAYLRERRGAAAVQVIDAPEDGDGDEDRAWLLGVTPYDDLVREWRRLEPHVRIALALGPVEGRSAVEVARIVGRPEDELRADVRAGLARLRTAGGSVADAELRSRLLSAVPGPVAWRLTDRAAAAEAFRGHRRRRTAGLAAVASALLVMALVVGFLVMQPLVRPPPPSAGGSADSGRPDVRPVDLLAHPARGSLAGDDAFLDRARRVGWGADPAPPVADREVVLATETPSGRVALVAGPLGRHVRGAWLTGPPGAPADELLPYFSGRMSRAHPAGVLLSDGRSATVVVVAAPEDEVDLSPRLEIAADGTSTRAYSEVGTEDGVAVVPVDDVASASAISFRVRRDGGVVHRSALARPDDVAVPAPSLTLEAVRAVDLPADPGLLGEAVARVAVPLALDPDALDPELLWSAALNRTGGLGAVAVVTGRAPRGGRVVTTFGYLGPAGTGLPIPCGTRTLPADERIAELTVAAVCSVSDGSEFRADRTWLVVTAPPDAVRAEVLDDRGTVLDTVGLVSGGSVSRTPEGAAAVRTLDAFGRPLDAAPVDARPTDAFGDYGAGQER